MGRRVRATFGIAAAAAAATGVVVGLSLPPHEIVAQQVEPPTADRAEMAYMEGVWQLTRDGHVVAKARWDDENETLHVSDEHDDGQAVTYLIWQPGHYDARHRHWTADDDDRADDAYRIRERDGAARKFTMCLGTYAKSPEKRDVLTTTCSDTYLLPR